MRKIDKIFQELMNTKIFGIVLMLFSLIVGNVLVYRNTSLGNPLIDFTYQLENSYRICRGEIPYKDFILVLTPGIYYLDAFFLNLFNQSNLGQIVLLILIHSTQIILFGLIALKLIGRKSISYLAIIVVAISESVFYPFVIYNTACYNLMLLCVLYYLFHKSSNLENCFLGIIATLPFYFKQNYGLFFLIAFSFFYFVECVREKRIIKYLFFIMGGSLSAISFAIFLMSQGIDIYNQFIYQTMIFPGREKHPFSVIVGNIINIFSFWTFISGLLVLIAALFLKNMNISERIKKIIVFFVMISFFAIISLGGASVVSVLWGLLYISLAIVWLNECLFKKNIFSNLSMLIVSIAIFTAGVFTKRIDGPCWLWTLAIALLLVFYKAYKWNDIFLMMMVAMLISNISMSDDCDYAWVNQEGELYEETDMSDKCFKMGIKGNWLNELKDISNYINTEIQGESFVEVPCEDPIYWISGTKPQLNFFQLYPETCPYDVEIIDDIIYENKIMYVIVKRKCQFNYYMINEGNVNYFEEQLVAHGYRIIDSFDSYVIYKKS